MNTIDIILSVITYALLSAMVISFYYIILIQLTPKHMRKKTTPLIVGLFFPIALVAFLLIGLCKFANALYIDWIKA
jgi:hypothetical protein